MKARVSSRVFKVSMVIMSELALLEDQAESSRWEIEKLREWEI